MYIVFLCFFLWYLKEYMIALGLILVYGAYLIIFKDRGLAIEYQNILPQYDKKQCVVPVKTRIFFPYLKENSEVLMPKEIYITAISGVGMTIFGFAFIIASRSSHISIWAAVGFGLIIGWYLVVVPVLQFVVYIKCFLYKYKRITRKNCRLLFWGRFYDKNDGEPVLIGKCRIISIISRNERKNSGYAVVQMIGEGSILSEVCFPLDIIKQDKNVTYSVYKICDVLYLENDNREGE